MRSWSLVALVACATLFVACGGGSTAGPTSPSRVPRISRTKFLAFGDSITAGEVTAPIGAASATTQFLVVPAASYPSLLQSQLASIYTSQASSISVTNMGVGGEPILDGRLRFDSVFSSVQPEVVLLLEGVVNLSFVGPDTSTAVMRDMVQRSKTGGARVFVGSMIPSPAGRSRSVSATALTAYNSVLQVMATQEGITYVDLYTPLLADAATLIGIDGLHPTEAGYRRIAELFLAAIRGSLEEP